MFFGCADQAVTSSGLMTIPEPTVASTSITPGTDAAVGQSAVAPPISNSAPSRAQSARLPFIQGLRGIAALSVALFHCYDATPVEHQQQVMASFPALLDGVMRLGFLGVDLFFGISGFVIAMTLYNRLSTVKEWGRFFLRRQLRLDPPYWTAIAISVVSAVAINAYRPDTNAPVPGVADVIAHLFYVQEFLGFHQIVGVFWTLCFEIQFYLFFGATILLLAWRGYSGRTFAWLMLPLYVLSIVNFWGLVSAPEGLFLSRWFEFFIGVIVFLAWRKHISRAQVWVYLSALVAISLINPPTDVGIARVTVATVLLIALTFWFAVESGGVKTWLDTPLLHYLGDISYSLYLMHALVGIRLLKIIVHAQDSALHTWLLYLLALVLSVAGADLMYRWIERPSMNLSHKLKWRGA
jgi:peptidoglycan/LPS O-acetylase OafA/YrhL